ncbi:MAG TPA: CoA transferase [Pyrinomonadaceae bacterium]|jgi:crotonobetainyl-CoA:carnitine CoA-transferase CaiB-like acyl-CoA transferase
MLEVAKQESRAERIQSRGGGDLKDALGQLKVLEFGGYAAGPCISKYLANFGASVVHVESNQRPDGFRLQYPPYKDGIVGPNRSGCFAFFNDSKKGVTLNLKQRQGLELAYRLVDWADIVIENMRPGAITRLGLGYERLGLRKPELIMLSTSNMGQTGPHASHPGFGSQLSSLSGFTNLIGEPDGPPYFLYGPYIDFVAVAYGGIAVLAALDYRLRTGKGVHIDLSQYEAGLQFLSSALLDYSANGSVARRDGNRDPQVSPHGCYPCRDGQWCVISCWDEPEWERLCRAADKSQWLSDARFLTGSLRKTHERELNETIGEWTRDQDARRLMGRLQRHGVHAAQVNTMRDLFSDPQIAFRDVWQKQSHPELGDHNYRMVSYDLSKTPGRVRGAAPCLGADNEEVFIEWLGLARSEYEELRAKGAFS